MAPLYFSLYFLFSSRRVLGFTPNMPDVIFQTDLLLQTIRHAILHKPTDLLVANYPAQSAQQEATVMETPDLLTVVAAPIKIGPRRIVQKIV